YLIVGWLWYLGTLVPVLGLVQVGSQAIADRYTYVPLIGLFLLFCWSVFDLLAGWRHQGIVLAVSAGAVLLACTTCALKQVSYWHDSVSLWTRALEVTEKNSFAH